jgi:hypothetical protein
MKLTTSFFILYSGCNQVFSQGEFAKSAKKGTFALPNRLRHFAKRQGGKEAPKSFISTGNKNLETRKKAVPLHSQTTKRVARD